MKFAKLGFLALAVLSLLAVPVHAQGITGWVGVFSQYVSAHGVSLHDKPVMQADITWNLPNTRGAYIDIWADQSLDGEDNEVDYTLGWSNDYLNVSVAYFDLQPVGKSGDTFFGELSFGMPKKIGKHSAKISATANRVAPIGAAAGNWLRVGVSDSWKIGKRTSFDQNAWLMHDGGAFDGPTGFILRYEAGLTLKRGKYALQPLIKVSVPISIDKRENQFVAGLKLIR